MGAKAKLAEAMMFGAFAVAIFLLTAYIHSMIR